MSQSSNSERSNASRAITPPKSASSSASESPSLPSPSSPPRAPSRRVSRSHSTAASERAAVSSKNPTTAARADDSRCQGSQPLLMRRVTNEQTNQTNKQTNLVELVGVEERLAHLRHDVEPLVLVDRALRVRAARLERAVEPTEPRAHLRGSGRARVCGRRDGAVVGGETHICRPGDAAGHLPSASSWRGLVITMAESVETRRKKNTTVALRSLPAPRACERDDEKKRRAPPCRAAAARARRRGAACRGSGRRPRGRTSRGCGRSRSRRGASARRAPSGRRGSPPSSACARRAR